MRRQAAGGLDERIAAVLDALAGERVVLVGMDTPHLNVAVLDRLAREPWPADAWFGPADDGGFWLLGPAGSRGDVVRGVPMSRNDTGARQRARLIDAGLRIADLDAMRDIDTYEDLTHVAALVPGSATAGVLARLGSPA